VVVVVIVMGGVSNSQIRSRELAHGRTLRFPIG
jgi:hypothetical protein